MWYKLIFLAVIICFIVDLSGVIGSIKYFIWKKILDSKGSPDYVKIKPFECSLCMTFWVGIIYLICCGSFTLPLFVEVCFLSFLTKNISGFLRVIQEALIALEARLYKLIQKL